MLLVTGISGHTGGYFLQELINNRYDGAIRCIVRNASDTTLIDNSGLKIEKVIGNLSHQEFMDSCMLGVDTVMHIGTIFYSLNVIKSAVKNKVRKVVLVHTTGIYSKFKRASAVYKDIENEITNIVSNESAPLIDITILRPTMIYGNICDHNMIQFIKLLDNLRIMPVINHGNGLFQPVNARDLGKAYYQVLVMPDSIRRKEYILSGERPLELVKAFKIISNCLKKKTIFISFPLMFSVLLARILKVITIGKVDYIEKVLRMSENRSFPHDHAMNDFGYAPSSFEEGIRIEVEQYLKQKNIVKESF